MLDLGCGWGPLLNFIRDQGATGVGVTLSSAQVAACRRHGLDVHLYDARKVTRDSFGPFDAVASVGGFEHFCSPEEYLAGRQEEIYREVFARVASVLPDDGRFYLQTMVWGRNMIPADQIDIDALGAPATRLRRVGPRSPGPPVSRLLASVWPGAARPLRRSALSLGGEHERPARLHRDDPPVERADAAPSFRKTLLKLQLLPRWLTSSDFRLAFTSGVSANKVCFERELLDHYRLVFEKHQQ